MGYTFYTHLARIRIPDSIAGGSYYVSACINYDSAVAVSWSPYGYHDPVACSGIGYNDEVFIRGPRFNVSSNPFIPPIISPQSTNAGSWVTVTLCTASYDTVTPASNLGIFLSYDQSYGNDILLDTLMFPPLQGRVSLTKQVWIPDTIPSGPYLLIFYRDYDQRINEHNEEDNIDVSILMINNSLATPELSPGNVSVAQLQAPAGGEIDFSFSVSNTGTGPAGSFNNALYLSPDSIYDAGDLLLKTMPADSLNGLSGYQYSDMATIPVTWPQGSGYLLFYTDNQQQVAEQNEGNNMVAVPLNVNGQISTGMAPAANEFALRLSPVPAKNNLKLWLGPNATPVQVEIFNAMGQLCYRTKTEMGNGAGEINISTLVSGLYVIKVTGAGGRTGRAKFEIDNR